MCVRVCLCACVFVGGMYKRTINRKSKILALNRHDIGDCFTSAVKAMGESNDMR